MSADIYVMLGSVSADIYVILCSVSADISVILCSVSADIDVILYSVSANIYVILCPVSADIYVILCSVSADILVNVNSRLFFIFAVIYKILYADDQHMVTYLCVGLQADGSCADDQMAVNILSRHLDIALETVDRLMSYFEGTCTSVDDVMSTTPGI